MYLIKSVNCLKHDVIQKLICFFSVVVDLFQTRNSVVQTALQVARAVAQFSLKRMKRIRSV